MKIPIALSKVNHAVEENARPGASKRGHLTQKKKGRKTLGHSREHDQGSTFLSPSCGTNLYLYMVYTVIDHKYIYRYGRKHQVVVSKACFDLNLYVVSHRLYRLQL